MVGSMGDGVLVDGMGDGAMVVDLGNDATGDSTVSLTHPEMISTRINAGAIQLKR